MARKKTREDWKTYGNVFDNFTLRNLFRLEGQGHITGLASAYRLGKEANVFIAGNKDGKDVIVKIYRLENCNFNKMSSYLSQDERFEHMKGQKRKIIFNWVQREYRNLLKAREVIRVPVPITVKDNIIIMEMIGDGEPALELKDEAPTNPEEFFDEVISMITRLKHHGLVHGDLSSFNILNLNDEPVFIDFSQATTTKSQGWEELLLRDLENVTKYFKKLGVSRDAKDIFDEIMKSEE